METGSTQASPRNDFPLRLGEAAFEFQQHRPEQFVIGRAGDERSLGEGAHERRRAAALGCPLARPRYFRAMASKYLPL